MRTFFAIRIPGQVIHEISEYSENLQKHIGTSVKWVDMVHMHLTLKFIGDFSPEHIEPVQQNLACFLKDIPPFELCICSSGVYPNYRKPRVLWLGLQSSPQLLKTAGIIEDYCARLGYEKEKRPFSPHLTIGRVRKNVDKNTLSRIGSIIQDHPYPLTSKFAAAKIFFIQSNLTPQGPQYSDLLAITI